MKDKKLIIIGDSAFAEIAFEYFTHDSEYKVVAFAVEAEYKKRDQLLGLPIIEMENMQEGYSPGEHFVFVATVYSQLNRLRTRLMNEAKEKGYRLASYISSKAFVWRNVKLGEHCFIFEDNTVQPFVTLGDNVILWSGNHIGHHSTIGSHCFISSHVVLSGFCTVGESCFLGVNSTVANNITIGDDCWIGPGALVTKDVEPRSFLRAPQAEKARVNTHRYFRIREDG